MDFATCSLSQEATLKDVDHIRQQIHRIKGGEEVRRLDEFYLHQPGSIELPQDIPMVVVGTKMDLVGPYRELHVTPS